MDQPRHPLTAATGPAPPARPRSRASPPSAAAVAILALALMVPAILSGFPLIFPDSGTYLGIAFAHDYAIDRSSFYGLMLKPLVNALPDMSGLWLALAAQATIVAGAILIAARSLGMSRSWRALLALLLLVPLTALPWHASQFMPDAFTGPLILLAIVAARRDPGADGTALLWLGAIALATTHYTHLILLPAAALTAIAADMTLGLNWRSALRRALAALIATALVAGALVASNGIALKRWTLSPVGSVFLFARLNQDGLIAPWIARHCGQDAPAELCAIYPALPRNSQILLWGGSASPVTHLIWAADPASRWRWAGIMATANEGAIREGPLAFATSAAAGTARQFITFAAIDDECPGGCIDPAGGITPTIQLYRPALLARHLSSAQSRGTTPKRIVRAVTTPIAALAILLLFPAAWIAWRRRDPAALAFCAAIIVSLLTNAALAGALSDVHDRYQSRVVWLAPFLLLFLGLRHRAKPCPEPAPDA